MKKSAILPRLIVLLGLCGVSLLTYAATPQQQFFKKLLPWVFKAEQHVREERQHLKDIHHAYLQKKTLNNQQISMVKRIAKRYNLPDFSLTRKADWQELLARVDVVPPSMILAQAANESAWGKSRFARLGYNYFGQWCYTPGCGIVPLKRAKNAHHEVKRFRSIYDSISGYMHNINTNRSYLGFRKMRHALRIKHQTLSGMRLAAGLINYSERRQQYVNSIRSLIRHHRLEKYDSF